MKILKGILFALSCVALSSVSVAAPNRDCYVTVDALSLVHGCFWGVESGPGLCESWLNRGPSFHGPLTLTSLNHFELLRSDLGLSVIVAFNGKRAQISIRAPHLNKTQVVDVTADPVGPMIFTATAQAEYHNRSLQVGTSYRVSCNFGLSAEVDANEDAEKEEMDRLGPAPEWSDATAASVADLPIGTTLELMQDLDIIPNKDKATTTFVEENGLMTPSAFTDLRLPYRFAFAQFYNANNGYMYSTHYPAGLKMAVTSVVINKFASGGHEYEITLKTVSVPASYQGTLDPIVRLRVNGRRSGSADIKVPQLEALLQPIMRLSLPQ
jgi:hypothetical protein